MREPASKDGKQGEQQKSSSKLNFFPPLPVGPGLLDGLNRKPLYDGPGLSLRPQPPAAPPLPRAPVAFSALPSAPTLMRSPAGALKVNDPGDAFEQEADRVADRVMRMGNPEVAQRPAAANEGLQRKCASCQEEEEESQIGIVQREEMGAMSGLESAAAPPIVHEVLRSPGEPLDASMRSFMEPRFGQSFSHVRVHTDAKAAESARAVDALAYTVGDNIVFDNGQYAPQTESGTRLMAHELAHTIQQGSGGLTVDAPASVQRQTAGDAATSKKPTVHRNVTQKGLLIPWKGTAEASIFSFLADFMPASLAHEITREVLGKSRFVIEGKSVSRATFDKKPGDFLLDDSLSRFLAQRTGLRLDDPGWLRLSQRDRKLLSDFAKARPDLAQSDKIRFDHLTTEVKQRMALQLADTTILGASAKAANDAFTNPRFLTVLVGTALLYYALWKIPHPIAKLAAGALTAYLLTQFTWHDLYGFAKAWDAFYDDCARAKSGDELKKAGNRFLSEAGPRVFDIMLAIVLWRVGRRKVGPKGGGSEAGKAGAEGGTTGAEPGRVEPKRAEPERVTPRSATSETSAASPDAESHPATAEPTGGEQTQAPSPPVAIPRIGEPPVADTSPSAPPKTPAEPEIKPPAEMQDQPRHIEAKTSELEVSQKPKTAEAAPVITQAETKISDRAAATGSTADSLKFSWPPSAPKGSKPKLGSPGAAQWRYQRYLYQSHVTGRSPETLLSFTEWKPRYYDPAASGGRPGRPGGLAQMAAKKVLEAEGILLTENVELGGRYPDGISKTPNSAGGRDYYEVGKLLNDGIPEARERIKLADEIKALGANDTVTFVDSENPARRVTYRHGDNLATEKDLD